MNVQVKVLRDGAKILVAYDGSDYSMRALNEAISLAKKFSGSVTLLHVFWEPVAARRVEGTEVRDQPVIRLMGDAEKALKASNVKHELRSENSSQIPDTILKVAKEGGFDTIAMGSRGMGGAKAWLLGSVSSKIAAESEIPVIITK